MLSETGTRIEFFNHRHTVKEWLAISADVQSILVVIEDSLSLTVPIKPIVVIFFAEKL